MSLTFIIDPEARLVRLSFSVNPNFETWAGRITAIISSPEYRPGFSFLGDGGGFYRRRRLTRTACSACGTRVREPAASVS